MKFQSPIALPKLPTKFAAGAMVAIPKNIRKQTTITKTDSLKMARPLNSVNLNLREDELRSRIYQI
ncbi:hypothetical protein [uncultured Campylobacter sp.]|uniref:hypothetical protein n=1 Tax=uncultured Campylobacter sp. TaxID=218934 RepID=UPI0028E8D6B1|nr:hypothetical protein [uncultured Campylobacter sp.]